MNLLISLLELAAAWTLGCVTGSQIAKRRRTTSRVAAPAETVPGGVPDDLAGLEPDTTGHDCDDHNHDTTAAATAGALMRSSGAMVRAVANAGGAPAAIVVCVPDTSESTITTTAMHPDAYPDSARFAADLQTLAAMITSRQGQINADTHHLRNQP